MDFGIAGKRAVVLGASRGLGAAIAAALAAEGVEVLALARSADALKEVAAGGGGRIRAEALDLSDAAAVAAFCDRLRAAGDTDILVNNGGGPKPGGAAGHDTATWTGAFAAMAAPLFAITDAVLPGMSARGWGRIITVGSSGVVQPIPNLGLSNAIRGAVAGWSKTLAAEVAGKGITVNMVLPGRIETDRVRSLDAAAAERSGKSVEAVAEASRATIPAGRYGAPEEFGAVAAFLASRQAGYVTGSMIRVDGGMIRGM
jgi:3-oxoacyl-[acyl-carrier protein] reductase